MNNNKLANAIVQIRNSGKARHRFVILNDTSRVMLSILSCLKVDGYIEDYMYYKHNNKNIIVIQLKYYTITSNIKIPFKEISLNMFVTAENKELIAKKQIAIPKVSAQYFHVIKDINIISKASCQVYSSCTDYAKAVNTKHTFSQLLISTNKGVMNHVNAIKQNLGGKVLLEVY